MNVTRAKIFTAALFLSLAVVQGGASRAADQGPVGQTSGVGEVVLSGDGSWGYNGPHAVIGDGKLLSTYIDAKGVIRAVCYQLESGEMTSGEVAESYADLHQASSLFVRPDGRVQVFVNKRGVYTDEKIFWKVGAEPGSVAAFGQLQESKDAGIAQGRHFYPLVHRRTGDVYLILNAADGGRRRIGMWKSTDGGDTFDEYHLLYGLADDLRGNRSYTRAYLQGDDIHLVAVRVGWNEPLAGQNIGRIEGLYYIRYNIGERAFYHADGGHAFGLEEAPVYDTRHFDEIWNWKNDGDMRHRVLWADIVAADGQPYVAFTVQAAVPQGESALHDGYWATPNEHGQWQSHKVATLARGWDNRPERVNYAIAIDPQSPNTVFVSKSTDQACDLSRVHRMVTRDGGATWVSEQVLSSEGRITTLVVPQVIDQKPRSIEVLWLEGRIEGWRDYATKIMMRRARR